MWATALFDDNLNRCRSKRICRRPFVSMSTHSLVASSKNDKSRRACWTRRRGVCSSCYDRSLGGLHPEVWQTQQFERVGVPLGEQVVYFRVVFVIGHAVVRDADASRRARRLDASRPPLCTMAEWRGCTTLPLGARAFSTASRPATRAAITIIADHGLLNAEPGGNRVLTPDADAWIFVCSPSFVLARSSN